MTEQTPNTEGTETGGDGDAPDSAVAPSPSDRVREVVGRRGYDEGEDEAATEDEEH
jgi:hypothetical protein